MEAVSHAKRLVRRGDLGVTDPDGGMWQVSTGDGAEPIWSKDGKELFYRSKDKLVSVSIETDPVFKMGAKKELFEDKYMKVPTHSNYDIHPDGNRFVMLKQLDLEGTFKIIVVQNWFKELRQAFRDSEK